MPSVRAKVSVENHPEEEKVQRVEVILARQQLTDDSRRGLAAQIRLRRRVAEAIVEELFGSGDSHAA